MNRTQEPAFQSIGMLGWRCFFRQGSAKESREVVGMLQLSGFRQRVPIAMQRFGFGLGFPVWSLPREPNTP